MNELLSLSLSLCTCVGAGYRHLGLIAVLAAVDTGVPSGTATQGKRAFRSTAEILKSMIESLAGQTILRPIVCPYSLAEKQNYQTCNYNPQANSY